MVETFVALAVGIFLGVFAGIALTTVIVVRGLGPLVEAMRAADAEE